MKKLFLLLSIIFALAGVSYNAYAQPASQLSLSVINFPDTAHVNQTYSFQFIVTNVDSGSFNGAVTIKFKVDTFQNTFGVNQTGNLVPFDTFSVAVDNFTFDPNAQFRTGDNVVVVWPSVNNAVAGDSLFLNVFIPDPNSITENELGSNVLIFPNPAKNVLTVGFNSPENAVEQVRIHTINGQLLINHVGTGPVDVSQLPRGVYLLEVVADKKRYYKKLFKD